MKKLKKLLVALLAATLMVSALPLSASAAAIENEVMPLWDNTGTVSCFVSLTDDGQGTAEASIRGYAGATSITCKVYVYLQNGSDWDYVTEDYFESSTNRLLGVCEFSAVNGGYYKAEYTITVTKDNVTEVITCTAYSE